MRTLAESLKRLYENSLIEKDKIKTMHEDGTISKEEMDYILGIL